MSGPWALLIGGGMPDGDAKVVDRDAIRRAIMKGEDEV